MFSLKASYQCVLRFENFETEDVWPDCESLEAMEFKPEKLGIV